MWLKYAPFDACAGLVAASKGRPSLRRGGKGPAVALLQGALVDLRYQDEVAEAMEFVEMLGVGTWDIRSKHPEYAYNRKEQNRNWFFAIGGYCSWGVGRAVVGGTGPGATLNLDFEYRFYDRYNWDKGKSVSFAGITVTDRFMGEFHRQGLAQEFDCFGSFKRHFSWKKGQPIPPSQLQPGGGR